MVKVGSVYLLIVRLMITWPNVTPGASIWALIAIDPSKVTTAPVGKTLLLSATRLPVIVQVGEAAVEMDDPALLVKWP